jgi:hypothetical protein
MYVFHTVASREVVSNVAGSGFISGIDLAPLIAVNELGLVPAVVSTAHANLMPAVLKSIIFSPLLFI